MHCDLHHLYFPILSIFLLKVSPCIPKCLTFILHYALPLLLFSIDLMFQALYTHHAHWQLNWLPFSIAWTCDTRTHALAMVMLASPIILGSYSFEVFITSHNWLSSFLTSEKWCIFVGEGFSHLLFLFILFECFALLIQLLFRWVFSYVGDMNETFQLSCWFCFESLT